MINMRFLVDESVGNKFANLLKRSGYNVIFVGEAVPEVDDTEVLSFAKHEKRILITADKDFGFLIFKLNMLIDGLILFRIRARDPEKRLEMSRAILDKAEGKFIVVKEGQIRIRDLKRM